MADESTPARQLARRWWTRLRRSFSLPDLMTDEHATGVIVRTLLSDHSIPVRSPGADTKFVTVVLESFLDACGHGEADLLLLPEKDRHLLGDYFDATEVNRFELAVLNKAADRQPPEPGITQQVVLEMLGDLVHRSIGSINERPYETSDGVYFA